MYIRTHTEDQLTSHYFDDAKLISRIFDGKIEVNINPGHGIKSMVLMKE